MGIDPSSPEMTFLLVMLHTGTMFAVLLYFWKRWLHLLNAENRKSFISNIAVATLVTGIIGLGLKKVIEKVFLAGTPKAEIEDLFKNLPLMAASLAAVGIVIYFAGKKSERQEKLNFRSAGIIGLVQGLCLPFRGFSRSGATISTGLYLGISKSFAEEFSFALAVVLTPPVVLRELLRLLKAHALQETSLHSLLLPGLIGMVFSFGSGLLALKWVSSWIEKGRWQWFSYYCFFASATVLLVHYYLG